MCNSNLISRRVFIVGDDSMFDEGVAHLLAFGKDMSVSGMKYTDDLAFLDIITQNQPDVVVLNEATSLDPVRILKLLCSSPSFAGLRVIVIRLTSSMIDVYEIPKQVVAREVSERRQFFITRSDELVSVVRG